MNHKVERVDHVTDLVERIDHLTDLITRDTQLH